MNEIKRHFFKYFWESIFILVILIVLQLFSGHVMLSMGVGSFLGVFLKIVALFLCAVLLAFIAYNLIYLISTLIGGLLTGYKFLSLNFLDLQILKRGGKLSFRRNKDFNILFMGLPLNYSEDKIPYFWYNALSFIVILVTSIITFYLTFYSNFDLSNNWSLFVFFLLLMYTVYGFEFVFSSLISFLSTYRKKASVGTLSIIRLFSKDVYYRQIYTYTMQINTLLYENQRLHEMPDSLFYDLPLDGNHNNLEMGYRSLYIYRLIGAGEYEQALAASEADDMSGLTDTKIIGRETLQYLFYRLIAEFYTLKRPEILRKYCTINFEHLLKEHKLYGLLYALERWCMLDEDEAKKINAAFEKATFNTLESESISRELIQHIETLAQEDKLPAQSIATIENRFYFTYNPNGCLQKLIFIPIIAFIVHDYVESGYQETINYIDRTITIEQENASMVKHDMIKALESNDCDRIKKALKDEQSFRENYPNSTFIDYDYQSLVSLNKKHLSELNCHGDSLLEDRVVGSKSP